MFKLKELENKYIYEDDKILIGFTKRTNGFSKNKFKSNNMSLTVGDDFENVIKNRKKLAQEINQNLENFVFLDQKHTSNIIISDSKNRGSGTLDEKTAIKETDAQITKTPNVVITTFHADCVPIIITNKKREFVATVHAGWQGSTKEITSKTIKKLNDLGYKSDQIEAIIGPASSEKNYIVKKDVIEKFENNQGSDSKIFYQQINETEYLLDVKKANYLQLTKAGLKNSNIVIMNEATTIEIDKFFSFRKEGETGRMITFAYLKSF